MSIELGSPVTIALAEMAWVDFVMLDTNGDPIAGLDLNTFSVWIMKQNGVLSSKSLSPNNTLKAKTLGVYSVLFSATDLDTLGLFCFVVEATNAAQYLGVFYVADPDGAEGGIMLRSLSWLPYRAISGHAATGVTGKTHSDLAVFYKKNGDVAITQKTIGAGDFTERGRGLYSIKFTPEELSDEGVFVYIITCTGVDAFIHTHNIALGLHDSFVFTVKDNGVAQDGVTVEVRYPNTYGLVGSVVTDADGEGKVVLGRGTYIATIRHGTKIFTTNNIPFEVTEVDYENVLDIDADGITPDQLASVTTVVGSCTICGPTQEPLQDVIVRVTILSPYVASGVFYCGYTEKRTNELGQAAFNLQPATTVGVSIMNTSVYRELEVPATDFNLLSEVMGIADPFTIVTPSFPSAPTHT